MKFLGWLLSLIFAFNLGAGTVRSTSTATDSELKQKVQEHMDVIVDESAAMVDDVLAEIRQDEHVQKAEEFAQDVREIVDDTAQDVQDHFGAQDTVETAGGEDTVEADEVDTVEEDTVEETDPVS